MGAIRTIAAVSATAGTPTPVLTGTAIATVSYWIANHVATILLGGNLPANGFTGPRFDLGTTGGGQQVTIWGLTTGTYLNGLTATIIDNDGYRTIRVPTTHVDVASAAAPQADSSGFVAPAPTSHYRAVRLEIDSAASTHIIYVGDKNVSTGQYMAKLTLAGQLSVVIASENIPADRIFIDTDNTGTKVQVSLIY